MLIMHTLFTKNYSYITNNKNNDSYSNQISDTIAKILEPKQLSSSKPFLQITHEPPTFAKLNQELHQNNKKSRNDFINMIFNSNVKVVPRHKP